MDTNRGKYVFATNGTEYDLQGANFSTVWPLPKAVYNLCFDPMGRGIFLKYYKPEFDFNFQRYPIDEEFIAHVIKRYPTMNKSMGVLLNGKKGAGKSVVAKTIANELGIPVIIVNNNYPGLADFIANINSPCCFFMDEFEKNFAQRSIEDENAAGQGLLSVMDGVYTGSVAHVFLLTTNQATINENLISRPGRILYSRKYECLDFDIVKSFIKDNLQRVEYEAELIDELSSLKEVTIDIVKSIVDEVNIMNISPSKACEYLNVEKSSLRFECLYYYNNDKEYTFEKFKKDIETYKKIVSGLGIGYRDANKRRINARILDLEEEGDNETAEDNSEINVLDLIRFGYISENVKPSKLKPRSEFGDMTVSEVYEGGKYVKFINNYDEISWYHFEDPTGASSRFN